MQGNCKEPLPAAFKLFNLQAAVRPNQCVIIVNKRFLYWSGKWVTNDIWLHNFYTHAPGPPYPDVFSHLHWEPPFSLGRNNSSHIATSLYMTHVNMEGGVNIVDCFRPAFLFGVMPEI
jgi:hypothetical protein